MTYLVYYIWIHDLFYSSNYYSSPIRYYMKKWVPVRALTADRNSMHPSLFEAIVLLHHNKSWWDATLVQEMLSKKWDQKLKATYDDQEFDTGGLGGEW